MVRDSYKVPIRIVLYREEGEWVAHCLEMDICGTGNSKSSSMTCLQELIMEQVAHSISIGNIENLFHQAPSEYLKMFDAGKDAFVGEMRIPTH